jgi:hypothetical protein
MNSSDCFDADRAEAREEKRADALRLIAELAENVRHGYLEPYGAAAVILGVAQEALRC